MLTEPDALYRLLPAYIRSRDQEIGGPLQQLLSIPGEQAAALQRDFERMYDGWFIETCDEWLVPYLGELVGVAPSATGQAPERLRRVLSLRAATANAIAQRRRKGTLWVLEEIARDFAHWPARAVEFYRQAIVASHLDHLHPERAATADVRSARRLSDLDSPFDEFCHTTDVCRIGSSLASGRYAVPNVGLFAWRLRPYSVTGAAAYCHEEIGAHCFSFSVLGNDAPLFQEPVPEAERSAIARAENLPVPISRLALERQQPLERHCAQDHSEPWSTHAPSRGAVRGRRQPRVIGRVGGRGRAELADGQRAQADPALYGLRASLWIEVEGWRQSKEQIAIPAEQVIPADLSEWAYRVPRDHVAVDPVLGRIAFPVSQVPRRGVRVSYRYGFAMDLGGGEYSREAVPLPARIERLQVVPGAQHLPESPLFSSIGEAFADWRARRDRAATRTAAEIEDLEAAWKALEASPTATAGQRSKALRELREATTPAALTIELGSGVYSGRFHLTVRAGETLAVMAAPGTRPVIWLADSSPGGLDAITVRGSRGSRVIFDGLLIAGRAIRMGNAAEGGQPEDGDPASTGELCEVWIRHSTLVPGNSLHPSCEPRHPSEPSVIVDQTSACLRLEHSISGAIEVVCEDVRQEAARISIRDSIVDATGTERMAIGGPARRVAHAWLSVWRSTVVGRVAVHALQYAEDSIFTSRLEVARRQRGCMRFCHVLPDSRTPKRYACQPAEASQVAPRFESMRYGSPNYLRLTACTATEIRRGAHDFSEMGVYHDLFEPQRLDLLTTRLNEFVPASCSAAIIFAS